jgi:hypothetical protein
LTIEGSHRLVHFVGSVPLASTAEVLEAIGPMFGEVAPRIPDGETGPRSLWIQFQRSAMERAKNLTKRREYVLSPNITQPVYGLLDPGAPVSFGALGYAENAIDSYRVFSMLKRSGQIHESTRFQVSLPTPLAVTAGFIEPHSQQATESAYEQQLLHELREICRAVPAKELAVQWDVAYEILFLAGYRGSTFYDMSRTGLMRRLIALGEQVPVGVELGYHLCYGDPGHKHLVEPFDLGLCVAMSNDLVREVTRSIEWIHMPVTRARNDANYFRPLRALLVPSHTHIILGLIHLTDGFDGAVDRVRSATAFLPRFDIATECGFGRRDPKTIEELLALHKRLALTGVQASTVDSDMKAGECQPS